MVGSSPLTRGAQLALMEPTSRIRLIPAHAGSTCIRLLVTVGHRAHPRSRGEHARRSSSTESSLGSSPLTRGALSTRHPCNGILGLIPAHAGSTHGQDSAFTCHRAHPRSRGEHIDAHRVNGNEAGSSPLTRGARVLSLVGDTAARLIPAHAGSTLQK